MFNVAEDTMRLSQRSHVVVWVKSPSTGTGSPQSRCSDESSIGRNFSRNFERSLVLEQLSRHIGTKLINEYLVGN
jgi:hypothetical protein